MKLKIVSLGLLALLFIGAGIMHFVHSDAFARIVPTYLPVPFILVWISGAAEILGGVGLLIPRFRRIAAIGLILLLVCVFPANINMAMNHIYTGWMNNDFLLWARLPLQLVLILWLEWIQKPA
jgi:uncharacterized membrane protein